MKQLGKRFDAEEPIIIEERSKFRSAGLLATGFMALALAGTVTLAAFTDSEFARLAGNDKDAGLAVGSYNLQIQSGNSGWKDTANGSADRDDPSAALPIDLASGEQLLKLGDYIDIPDFQIKNASTSNNPTKLYLKFDDDAATLGANGSADLWDALRLDVTSDAGDDATAQKIDDINAMNSGKGLEIGTKLAGGDIATVSIKVKLEDSASVNSLLDTKAYLMAHIDGESVLP
ncbi:MAG: hypothetical protein LBR21_00575 [Propionibacteriaceae bacterium]|jgi:predicted ribosomally synthesized peptide with SipW-like signal peptide|nr:hypothetical protein [Propionibacteriaceae bacterium]